MATFKEAIEYARQNPNSTFAKDLESGIKSGQLNSVAKSEGIDLSPFIKQSEPVVEQPDVPGTGFNPTFPVSGEEGVGGLALKTVGNIPKSGFELAKGVVSAVTHPRRTVKAVGDIVQGTGEAIGKAFVDSDFGQSVLEKISKAAGTEPKRDENGKIVAQTTQDYETAKAVGGFIMDRYGSMDKLKETIVEDPVGVLADLSTVLTGGGAALTKVGQVSKVAEISKVGGQVSKVASAVEPITAATKATGQVANAVKPIAGAVKNSTVGKIVSQVSPSVSRFSEGQIAKAFNLTKGDIKNIEKSTRNNIQEFTQKNDVLGVDDTETISKLDTIQETSTAERNAEIAKVTSVYKPEDVPRVRQTAQLLLDNLDGTIGNEKLVGELQTLIKKAEYTLDDVQKTKQLLDKHGPAIFKSGGEVKGGATPGGIKNVRDELKKFVEVEVKNNTGADIADLNNKIQTSVELKNTIKNRANAGATNKSFGLTDTILGVGLGGAAVSGGISVPVALGIFITKKVMESPAFRLALIRSMNKIPKNISSSIAEKLQVGGKIPAKYKALVQKAVAEAKKNAGVIESGSKLIESVKDESDE